jgi:hypothetical protein
LYATNPLSTFKTELFATIDTTHQFYYANVVDPTLKDLDQLETLNNKAVDVVDKKHMTIFHKQLPVCDLSLGLEVL